MSEGLLEYVGPLVDPMAKEKPLSIALREINAGLLDARRRRVSPTAALPDGTPAVESGPAPAFGPMPDRGSVPPESCSASAAASPPTRHASCCGGCVHPTCWAPTSPSVPTAAALRFVGAATLEALSGHPVAVDVFSDVPSVAHVRTGQHTDLVVVAPATADLLARAAAGLADDLLTATLLVTRAPVLMAPAMHTEMWTHPATVANVAVLRSRGVVVLDPAVGRLTGADSGAGPPA